MQIYVGAASSRFLSAKMLLITRELSFFVLQRGYRRKNVEQTGLTRERRARSCIVSSSCVTGRC